MFNIMLNDYKTSCERARAALTEPDMGIDLGAWSDVPDATKWVDELRGDDESEQEPVAWDADKVDASTQHKEAIKERNTAIRKIKQNAMEHKISMEIMRRGSGHHWNVVK